MLKARFYLVYTYFSLVFTQVYSRLNGSQKESYSVRSKVGVHM